MLEHVNDRNLALKEARRVLSTGGRVVTIVPNAFWKFLELATAPARWAINVFVRGRGTRSKRVLLSPSLLVHGDYSGNREEFRAYSERNWVSLHRDAGFQGVSSQGLIGYMPFELPIVFESLLTRISPVTVAVSGVA